MKIRVLETCSLVAQKGSIVEVTQPQYEALGDLCELIEDSAKVAKNVIETPEKVVETAVKEDIKFVGLSALMTTTVVNMEETIRQLKAVKPDCKIMVGGAVLTKDYAESIGADFYAKDAMMGVAFAKEVL